MIADTPMQRLTIDQLDRFDFGEYLSGIRERRLKARKIYERAKAEKDAIAEERLRGKIAKQIEMFNKEDARVEKAIDALTKRMANINALRLEAGTYGREYDDTETERVAEQTGDGV